MVWTLKCPKLSLKRPTVKCPIVHSSFVLEPKLRGLEVNVMGYYSTFHKYFNEGSWLFILHPFATQPIFSVVSKIDLWSLWWYISNIKQMHFIWLDFQNCTDMSGGAPTMQLEARNGLEIRFWIQLFNSLINYQFQRISFWSDFRLPKCRKWLIVLTLWLIESFPKMFNFCKK